MPFAIAGNIDKIERTSLRQLEKRAGIILSSQQPLLQQRHILAQGIKSLGGVNFMLETLSRRQLLSLIFIITQFGDVSLEEIPSEYTDLRSIPYVLEWKKNFFMIPFEFFENLSQEKLFKDQGYLFALIPSLGKEEKKAWIKWIGADYEPNKDKSIDFEIHSQCRSLQKPYNGKSLIQDTEFYTSDIWPVGNCEEMDWYYKGMTSFYYALHILSKKEKDPFKRHVIDIIRCGKYILKKPEKYLPNSKSVLLATVEGSTPQIRDSFYQWEKESSSSPTLFHQ